MDKKKLMSLTNAELQTLLDELNKEFEIEKGKMAEAYMKMADLSNEAYQVQEIINKRNGK